jgi:A/G-specific adenine glycosylase
MEFGATLCTPRNPQCLTCPVKKLCVAFKEGRTEELPNLGKRQEATARRFFAFAIEQRGKFLVRQRPAGVVNAHLWEFPNVEVGLKTGEPAEVFSELDFEQGSDPQLADLKLICTVKHSITRYRITLEAFAISLRKVPAQTGSIWKTPAQMRTLAFTSAHKKILGRLVPM